VINNHERQTQEPESKSEVLKHKQVKPTISRRKTFFKKVLPVLVVCLFITVPCLLLAYAKSKKDLEDVAKVKSSPKLCTLTKIIQIQTRSLSAGSRRLKEGLEGFDYLTRKIAKNLSAYLENKHRNLADLNTASKQLITAWELNKQDLLSSQAAYIDTYDHLCRSTKLEEEREILLAEAEKQLVKTKEECLSRTRIAIKKYKAALTKVESRDQATQEAAIEEIGRLNETAYSRAMDLVTREAHGSSKLTNAAVTRNRVAYRSAPLIQPLSVRLGVTKQLDTEKHQMDQKFEETFAAIEKERGQAEDAIISRYGEHRLMLLYFTKQFSYELIGRLISVTDNPFEEYIHAAHQDTKAQLQLPLLFINKSRGNFFRQEETAQKARKAADACSAAEARVVAFEYCLKNNARVFKKVGEQYIELSDKMRGIVADTTDPLIWMSEVKAALTSCQLISIDYVEEMRKVSYKSLRAYYYKDLL
jgi:hypothetical protein